MPDVLITTGIADLLFEVCNLLLNCYASVGVKPNTLILFLLQREHLSLIGDLQLDSIEYSLLDMLTGPLMDYWLTILKLSTMFTTSAVNRGFSRKELQQVSSFLRLQTLKIISLMKLRLYSPQAMTSRTLCSEIVTISTE